ncbi:prepilin-type N-terminal cleavage/methylation domain-containing protein [Thermodesulfobacterium sp. TA1]|uniref:prepilin-type N-terminal cleavage/methylation domain-containing protein n=1 Tax=Thermodesulfobacterium sp. TA1 TaxID=2234087 RepID=UPI001231F5F6|nr:prepilin-type N-terminal cleavage/methylation domain-containing protein [Thermodesulfobacterium sp. TA1]QER42611.1 prepilin-type N-terminal cleavage/methylation domain-containing protein [Thermodesulfobacterium sp. TA1]
MKNFEKKFSKGFTLIEIAIVLVILGLLIGLGASLVGVLTQRAKITEAREVVNAAVESLIGFATQTNRLPTLLEFSRTIRNPNDPWNKPLNYFVDPSLTSNPNHPAEGICGKKTTNLIVCTDTNCNFQIPNVAFIVVSGGPNYNIQTGNLTNPPCPTGKTCYRVYPQGTQNIDDYPYDFTRPEEYDDIVKWVTLEELRIKMGCQGAQLKILNNELPYGYVNTIYNAIIYAEGGVPFTNGNGKYKWCVEVNGTLPGINLTPTATSNNCTALPENSWGQADFLTLTGTPNQSGSFYLSIFVRDDQDQSGNNDNIAQKTLILTINPQTSSNSTGTIGAQISFADNINQFQENENNPSAVQVIGNTLLLGGNTGNTYGCFWFPSSYTLNGKKLRAYFKFKFLTVDTSPYSTGYADGFTFAVVDGNMPTNVCGSAGEGLGFLGLNYDSIAVEFDVYPNSGRNDPINYNHVAIVKRGTVTHNTYTLMGDNPSCTSNGCYRTNVTTWLEDGIEHTARVEIHTGCNPSCNNCGNNPQNYALLKAWIDCSNCNDLTQDYASNPTIQHCFQLPQTMSSVKFGFTEATGGRNQNIEIKDFGIGFY